MVENAFAKDKNKIQIRPVFHYKETRIKGHVFACFMSYYLLHKFKQEAKELLKKYQLENLLIELKCIKKTYLIIDKLVIEKINELNEVRKELLKHLR